jgi:translation elongation factor EF-4
LTQRSPQDIIPRQQFKVPIQAKIGEKIVASAQVLTLLAVLALLVQKYEYTDAG